MIKPKYSVDSLKGFSTVEKQIIDLKKALKEVISTDETNNFICLSVSPNVTSFILYTDFRKGKDKEHYYVIEGGTKVEVLMDNIDSPVSKVNPSDRTDITEYFPTSFWRLGEPSLIKNWNVYQTLGTPGGSMNYQKGSITDFPEQGDIRVNCYINCSTQEFVSKVLSILERPQIELKTI